MSRAALSPALRPRYFGSMDDRRRWYQGIGVTGPLIVAGVALVTTINNTAWDIVTAPFSIWSLMFLFFLTRNVVLGLATLGTAVWVRNRDPAGGLVRYAVAAGAIIVVTGIVWFLGAWIYAWMGWGASTVDMDTPPAILVLLVFSRILRYSAVGVVITGAWLYLCTQAEHAAAVEQCAIDAEQMDRQTAEARLQVLEAQIEPHFLFNTLAHVRRLYETDPAAGARMLHNLAGYLASALPQMRTAATLGHELDHITAYLNIQQIRMGHRLTFAIDAPEAARDAALPPLMVLTLVENAIKHGLSPLREGGRIDVRASVAGGRLIVQVADTGQGFTQSSGGGTGLANTRARLASKYGAGASFSLAHNEPRGVVATISLPYEAVAAVGSPP